MSGSTHSLGPCRPPPEALHRPRSSQSGARAGG
jgi:hypothetical protein